MAVGKVTTVGWDQTKATQSSNGMIMSACCQVIALEFNICEDPAGEQDSSFISQVHPQEGQRSLPEGYEEGATSLMLYHWFFCFFPEWRSEMSNTRWWKIPYYTDFGYCSVIFGYSSTITHSARGKLTNKHLYQNPNGMEGVMVNFNDQLDTTQNHLRESLNKVLSRSGCPIQAILG